MIGGPELGSRLPTLDSAAYFRIRLLFSRLSVLSFFISLLCNEFGPISFTIGLRFSTSYALGFVPEYSALLNYGCGGVPCGVAVHGDGVDAAEHVGGRVNLGIRV